MAKLKLTLACGAYEITRALWDGTIEPDGIDLTVLTGDRDRIFHIRRRQECDVAEFNVMNFMVAREEGYAIKGLPVFPHRRFRHGFIFVNTSKGIAKPADLAGRAVGLAGYRSAAVVWIKGILNEHYGVGYDSVNWINLYGVPGEKPSQLLRLPDDPARGGGDPLIDSRFLAAVDDLLVEGVVDAMISPGLPGPVLRGDARIGRLFADAQQEERRYFATTGIFPIMHIITVKEPILDEFPWVASSLGRAFQEAKELAYKRIRNPRVVPLVFFEEAWEDQEALFGHDPWSFGLTPPNRRNLETAARYAFEQGLVKRLPDISQIVVDVGPAAFIGGTGGF